jgi:hypothetical protein
MRQTLVDRLRRNLDRDDHRGPDWPTVVEDAVLAQDMQWVREQMACGIVRLPDRAGRVVGLIEVQ